jgi:hypothetical protein
MPCDCKTKERGTIRVHRRQHAVGLSLPLENTWKRYGRYHDSSSWPNTAMTRMATNKYGEIRIAEVRKRLEPRGLGSASGAPRVGHVRGGRNLRGVSQYQRDGHDCVYETQSTVRSSSAAPPECQNAPQPRGATDKATHIKVHCYTVPFFPPWLSHETLPTPRRAIFQFSSTQPNTIRYSPTLF